MAERLLEDDQIIELATSIVERQNRFNAALDLAHMVVLLDKKVKEREQVIRDASNPSIGVWYWQGDGDDFPESLTCPILISADKMRSLLSQLETKTEQIHIYEEGLDFLSERAIEIDNPWGPPRIAQWFRDMARRIRKRKPGGVKFEEGFPRPAHITPDLSESPDYNPLDPASGIKGL